jgi:tripeptidyl-peptidase-1
MMELLFPQLTVFFLRSHILILVGTSCAAPTFGGIIALLNDARISVGKAPLGFLNPLIYSHPEIFNDITEGNNPGCGTDGFFAACKLIFLIFSHV